MATRPAPWYLTVTILGAVAALVGIPAMEMLQHMHLTLWLHIPLTVVALTLIGGGALVSGVAYLEYQARSTKVAEKA